VYEVLRSVADRSTDNPHFGIANRKSGIDPVLCAPLQQLLQAIGADFASWTQLACRVQSCSCIPPNRRHPMNKQHLVSLSIAGLLAAALHAGPVTAADIADITIAKDGSEHMLSVDLDTLTDGQTLQLSTQAGVPAIVSRDGNSLDVEIAGERHEVKVGHLAGALWVDTQDGEHEIEVIRLGEGEKVTTEFSSDTQVKVVNLHGSHEGVVHEGDGRKVFVVKREGEGPIDEAELETLIEEAKLRAGVEPGDGTRITVERRITRGAND
jgi:hypothetical protein